MTLLSPKTFCNFTRLSCLTLILLSNACTADSPKPRSGIGGAVAGKGAININTADKPELMRLPGIGPKTAEKILFHRAEFGPFEHKAELILVDGFGEAQYLKLMHLVKTE